MALWFAGVLGLVAVAALAVVIDHANTWPKAMNAALAAGKKPRLDNLVKVWAWRGLLIDGVLAALLALTVRWWVGTVRQREKIPSAGRRYWFVALGILLLAAGLRVPRLDLSFYNDEAHNFRRMTAGELKPDPAKVETFSWDQNSWVETLWFNGAGNNSQPHSLLSRLTYQSWKATTGGADGEVCEWAVRLPAFAAGLGSLLLLGLAARQWQGNLAGWSAMLVGAVHGWHVRYSTEARGYSLMIFGLSLALWSGRRAMQYGRWRDWLVYALGCFLAFWAFPGSVYWLAATNGLLVGCLLWRARSDRQALDSLLRLGVSGLLAVMLALPLMLPLIPQLLEAVKHSSGMKGVMEPGWWFNAGSSVLFGARWQDADATNPASVAVARMVTENPLWWGPVGAAVVVAVLGLGRLWSIGGLGRVVAVSTLGAVVLGWADMTRQERYLNLWYVTFALPVIICALGLGLEYVAGLWRGGRGRQYAVWSLVLALTSVVACRATVASLRVSKGNERGPVEAVRGSIYPHYFANVDAKRPLFAAVWSNAGLYDPLLVTIHNPGMLDELRKRAVAEQRPLYVVLGHRQSVVTAQPETLRAVESDAFEPVRVFPGLDEAYYAQTLYRLRQPAGSTTP